MTVDLKIFLLTGLSQSYCAILLLVHQRLGALVHAKLHYENVVKKSASFLIDLFIFFYITLGKSL
jgi:hypothetical protein